MFRTQPKGLRLLGSYFITYGLVLLIPMIAACACYFEAVNMIRGSIETENRVLLQQAAGSLDASILELSELGSQMAISNTLSAMRSVEKPLEYPYIHSYFRMRDALPERSALGSFLYDYFLFFNQGQAAVNDRYAYSYDDFYTLYMHRKDQSLDDWKKEMLDPSFAYSTYSVLDVLSLSGSVPEEKTLIALSFSFLPHASHDGQVILFIDQQELLKILTAFHLAADDIACIVSGDGTVLACTASDPLSASRLLDTLADDPNSLNLVQHTIGNKQMLISRCHSDQTGLCIIIARSSRQVYARMDRILWIMGASMVAAALLGLVFSYLFSRRSSSFLRRLASGTEAQHLNRMTYGKAFQSLRKTFDDIQIANESMEKTLSAQQPYLQNAFLTQLLNGDFSSEDKALAVARNILSFSPESPMRVLLLHFPGNSSASDDSLALQLSANCTEVIALSIRSLEPGALSLNRSESDLAVLLCGEALEERIEKLVRFIRSNLPEGINTCLFAYAGNPVEKLTDVVRSWDNASSMIYMQSSPADVPVQYYQENESSQLAVFYPQDLQRRLINSMMNADDQTVLDTLKLIKEKNRRGSAIPAYIAQLLIDSLLNTLLQINAMADLPPDHSERILASVKSLMDLPISSRLDMIDTLYVSLCGVILQMKSDSKQQVIDEVAQYIRGHYMDEGLSLTSVADRFHVSESYLSFTFKAQTGTNFFSYVEDLRISQAKALLRETSLKISEIAEKTGYASTNSFCRAFKRKTGESASNYRSRSETD